MVHYHKLMLALGCMIENVMEAASSILKRSEKVGTNGDVSFSDIEQPSLVRKQMRADSYMKVFDAEAESPVRKHKISGRIGATGDVDFADVEGASLARNKMRADVGTEAIMAAKDSIETSATPLRCTFPQCDRSPMCTGATCCASRMFDAVSEITTWMNESDIHYVLLAGTLLGAFRDNDMIPWTWDIDIGIFKKDLHKVLTQHSIDFRFENYEGTDLPRGCEFKHPGFPSSVVDIDLESADTIWKLDAAARGFTGGLTDTELSKFKLVSYWIDIYVLDSPNHGGDIQAPCLNSSLSIDGNLERTTVMMRGKEFFAPKKTEEYLRTCYGRDWKIPDPEHRGRQDHI